MMEETQIGKMEKPELMPWPAWGGVSDVAWQVPGCSGDQEVLPQALGGSVGLYLLCPI